MEFSIEEFNEPSKSFNHNYIKIGKLGNGAFGKVYKAKEIKTEKIVAVKQISINNSKIKYEYILKEINVLSNLSHPNIVKYYKHYEENDKIYIIMEYLEGGTLKQYINEEKNKINEDICRIIIKQILEALSYLHYTCDICHRDIKPENIMFKYNNDPNSVKLIDFGLSSDSFEKKNYLDNCGTLIYMAPEQISNKTYSKSVDIWSVGIILYMLLNNGKNPFYNKGESREKIIEKITSKKVEFDDKNYPISEIGKHFINKLLMKNSSSRYTARPALKHPWITMKKFEEIPMTVLDKLLTGSYVKIIKELFLTSLFMNYYKKNKFYLNLNYNNINNINNISFEGSTRKACYTSHSHVKQNKLNNIKKNEINKNNNLVDDDFDLDEYFQRVKKSNLLLEKKFKENREIMFMTKKDTNNIINKNINTNVNIFGKSNNKIEIKDKDYEDEKSELDSNILKKKKNNIIYNIKNKSNKIINKSPKNKIIKLFNNEKKKIKNIISDIDVKNSRNKKINNKNPQNNINHIFRQSESKKENNIIKPELKTLEEFITKEKTNRNKSVSQYNRLYITDNLKENDIYNKYNSKDIYNNDILNYKLFLKDTQNQNSKNKLIKKNSCVMTQRNKIDIIKNFKNISNNNKIILIDKNKNKSTENVKCINFNKNIIKNIKMNSRKKSSNKIGKYNYYSFSEKNNNKFNYNLVKKNNDNTTLINDNIYNLFNVENKIKPKKLLFELKNKILPKIDIKNNFC